MFGLTQHHALVGENGAGKSTLIKIITGAEPADAGTLSVAGVPLTSIDTHTTRALGIAAIYQQPALFPHLTVAENIALSLERGSPWRRIDRKARRRRASELLGRVGATLDPDRLVGTLTMKDTPVDRLGPRQRLTESLDAIFKEPIDRSLNLDAVEGKLFGIGFESYTVGSHEFYFGYALTRQVLYTLDTGHYHPTETITDKLSAVFM